MDSLIAGVRADLGMLRSAALLVVIGPFAVFCLWSVWRYFSSPLRKYPGPFLAGWTNIWRMYHIAQGSYHIFLNELHRRYGPVVRVGPNMVDVDLPDMFRTVFNVRQEWKKTEMYQLSSALVDGRIVYNLFSQIDPRKHAEEKRPIAKFYSIASIASFEPHMNRVLEQLCRELEHRFTEGIYAGRVCDLGAWIGFYTWDVVGQVTFSQPIGYLEKGYDFDGTLGISEKALDYFAIAGQIPALDHVLDKNPLCHIGPPGFGTITGISIKHLIDRYQGLDKEYHDASQPDFLDRFIEAKNEHPDSVNDKQVVSWLMINMIAGADTTAITIRSALYYALRDQRVWMRLREEVLGAGITEFLPVAYKDARALPYLDAVVREAMRMLPGVSLSLERYVPSGGYQLPDGTDRLLPAGSIVALNPYVTARNRSVYGEDVDAFRPERWLRDDERGETEERYRERLAAMNSADLTFGKGTRVCLGKTLGLFQVYKVVATLVARFDIELADPTKEWKVINSWFPRQEGFHVRLAKRR